MTLRLSISAAFLSFLAALIICGNPNPAFALSTVTISSSGEGIFLLQGIGIEDASAMEINITYDTATLFNPRVVEGPLVTGAMTAVNPNIPGTVRIVMIRLTPIRGNGVIATLTFDRIGAASGRINDLNVRLANAKGSPLAALVQVNNPPDTLANSSYASQEQNLPSSPSSVPVTAAVSGVGPTVIIAGQQTKPDETRDIPNASQPGNADGQAVKQSTDSLPEKEPVVVARTFDGTGGAKFPSSPGRGMFREMYMQKSVLDLFRDYRGEKTADALFALFDRESLIGCRQEPLVALSDGKSVVKVIFIAPPGDLAASDIAVMGARLLSLKKDTDNTNTWIAELLPETGEYRVSMAVSQGNLKMIYPLTIAPKMEIEKGHSGQMTKADYDRYLKKVKTSGSSAKNMDNDRSKDYVNDYIVAANYLAAMKKFAGITDTLIKKSP